MRLRLGRPTVASASCGTARCGPGWRCRRPRSGGRTGRPDRTSASTAGSSSARCPGTWCCSPGRPGWITTGPTCRPGPTTSAGSATPIARRGRRYGRRRRTSWSPRARTTPDRPAPAAGRPARRASSIDRPVDRRAGARLRPRTRPAGWSGARGPTDRGAGRRSALPAGIPRQQHGARSGPSVDGQALIRGRPEPVASVRKVAPIWLKALLRTV